jgi:hypothetical protein
MSFMPDSTDLAVELDQRLDRLSNLRLDEAATVTAPWNFVLH